MTEESRRRMVGWVLVLLPALVLAVAVFAAWGYYAFGVLAVALVLSLMIIEGVDLIYE